MSALLATVYICSGLFTYLSVCLCCSYGRKTGTPIEKDLNNILLKDDEPVMEVVINPVSEKVQEEDTSLEDSLKINKISNS